jgi:SAM-dependent methyltransferase
MWASDPFDQHTSRYEAWFLKHRNAYEAEVRAVRQLVPSTERAIEIGVGTGRFAIPLGIRFGMDPSRPMLRLARARGLEVAMAVGEALPFPDSSFDAVLMVTTVCFPADVHLAFLEARRVLRPGGCIVLGLVDRTSPLGSIYLERRDESVFYRVAEFYSVEEIVDHLTLAGFHGFGYRQTLFDPPEETPSSEFVKSGYGEGSFAVVRGWVPQSDVGQRASGSLRASKQPRT